MSNYKLFCLDGAGQITSVELLEAKDDGDAVVVAQTMGKAVSYEVWDRNRLVARLPALRAKA